MYVQVHVADDAGPIGDVIELWRNHFGEAAWRLMTEHVDRTVENAAPVK